MDIPHLIYYPALGCVLFTGFFPDLIGSKSEKPSKMLTFIEMYERTNKNYT